MLLLRCGIGLSRTGEETLQSARFNAGLTELPCGTGSRREAVDFVAVHLHGSAYRGQGRGFACTCKSLNTLDTVGRAEYIFDHALLCAIQVRMPIGDLDR